MKIYLSKSCNNLPEAFVPCIDLMAWINISFGFIDVNGCLDILFWTISGRDVVN